MSIHQTMMTSAHARWNGRGELHHCTILEFYGALFPYERAAVVLGHFNYQTTNGGLVQWVDNGYASAAHRYIRGILAAMPGPLAKQVDQIVSQVYALCPHGEADIGDDGDVFDDLDAQYFAICEDFLQECEAYLRGLVAHDTKILSRYEDTE